ncbi:MAG: trehalose synthase, partial [Phycicoccus sp.]
FLFQTDSYPGAPEGGVDPMRWLRDIRQYVTRRLGDAALLGEVNVPYAQQQEFFGGADGDGLNIQFDFVGMQRAYLAFAREEAGPLVEALRERPALDTTSQWANFVRNHDELTLDKLSDDERAEVFAAFGPDPDMQLYGRGLRRRLPPMVGGDDRRVRLAYSLAFSLPGTPVLFYGEEIGMGENLDVPGRLAVRTPMQWDDGANGGFSDAAPDGVPRPVPTGAFAPERVNVAAQRQDPDSLWSFVRTLVRARRQMPEIGWSQVEVLDHGEPAVLAHLCHCDGWSMLAVHNLSSSSREVELALPPSDLASPVDGTDADGGGSEAAIRLQDALPGSATEERLDSQRRVRLVLPPYAGRWLRVLRPGERSW